MNSDKSAQWCAGANVHFPLTEIFVLTPCSVTTHWSHELAHCGISTLRNNKYFNSEFYLSIFSSRESDDTTFTLRLLISPLVEKRPHFFEKVQDTESFLSKILVI